MRARILALSPARALTVGLVAGALGSAAQSLFFRLTKRLAPKSSGDAFQAPEPAQRDESATATVARRVVEGLFARGPLEHKDAAGQLVHYAFGAAWGGLYGLARSSSRALSAPLASLGFGSAVWMGSDNLMLPILRLAAWPTRYPPKTHAYALAAHWVYGIATWAAFEGLSRALKPHAQLRLDV